MEKSRLPIVRAYLRQWEKINDHSSPGMSEWEMVNQPGDFFLLLGVEGDKREPHATRENPMPQESEDGKFGLDASFVLSSLSFVWEGRNILNGLGQPLMQAKELFLYCFLFLISLELSLPYFVFPILALRVQCLPLLQSLFLRRRFLNPKSHSLSISGISLPPRSALPFSMIFLTLVCIHFCLVSTVLSSLLPELQRNFPSSYCYWSQKRFIHWRPWGHPIGSWSISPKKWNVGNLLDDLEIWQSPYIVRNKYSLCCTKKHKSRVKAFQQENFISKQRCTHHDQNSSSQHLFFLKRSIELSMPSKAKCHYINEIQEPPST